MVTNEFRTIWFEADHTKSHEYLSSLVKFITNNIVADTQLYFNVTMKSYEKLIVKGERIPLVECLNAYHDQIYILSSTMILNVCKSALMMLGEIVKSALNSGENSNENVILANIMAKVAEHRTWNGIYPAFRRMIHRSEQHYKLMFDINNKYSIALVYYSPWP